MATIEVRAEVTTTEFERGVVFDAEDDDRTRTLIDNGYLRPTGDPVNADVAAAQEDVRRAQERLAEADGNDAEAELVRQAAEKALSDAQKDAVDTLSDLDEQLATDKPATEDKPARKAKS